LTTGAPPLVEPRPYDLPDRNEIRSYATKALVPYIKDDERPNFDGGQGAVYGATLATTTGLLRRTHVEAFASRRYG
jgi:hypothetical protein